MWKTQEEKEGLLYLPIFLFLPLFVLLPWCSKISFYYFLCVQRISFSCYFSMGLLVTESLIFPGSENVFISSFIPEGYFHWM